MIVLFPRYDMLVSWRVLSLVSFRLILNLLHFFFRLSANWHLTLTALRTFLTERMRDSWEIRTVLYFLQIRHELLLEKRRGETTFRSRQCFAFFLKQWRDNKKIRLPERSQYGRFDLVLASDVIWLPPKLIFSDRNCRFWWFHSDRNIEDCMVHLYVSRLNQPSG